MTIPDNRESELREILAQEYEALSANPIHVARVRYDGVLDPSEQAALAAMRRVSVPLTPSDEMVNTFIGSYMARTDLSFHEAIRNALQAALNLMGGKK